MSLSLILVFANYQTKDYRYKLTITLILQKIEGWSTMRQTDDSSQRFYDYLPERPRWGYSKILDKISDKKDIISTANYIQLPTQKRGYIALDLDYDMALFAWDDLYLPEPTIRIMNKENRHAQYLYELENPVLLPLNRSTINISHKAIRFYKAVTAGYQDKLESDKGYSGYAIKNPFSTNWHTIWSNKIYNLQYLAEFVDLPVKLYAHGNDIGYVGRHDQVFNVCRKLVYQIVKHYTDFDEFKKEVDSICLEYTVEHIWLNGLNLDFTKTEVLSISRSIANWVWKHRSDPRLKQYMKNIGTMKLEKNMTDSSSATDNNEYIRLNQSSGAKYTHKIRTNKTLDEINRAIIKLKSMNRDITLDNITRFSNLSYSTVYRNKKLILDLNN